MHPSPRTASELPHALKHKEAIRQKLANRKPVLFLDYDGTLSHIVKDPDKALLTAEMKDVLARLAQKTTVTVISGRDRADVQQKVGLEQVVYAGSHGFDIEGPGGLALQYEEGQKAQPALDKATQNLKSALGHIPGVWIERKKYAIAVHYRNVAEGQEQQVIQEVENELSRHQGLKKGGGKKIIELKPSIDWHKGRATEWLLKKLELDPSRTLPIFMGDDLTDEDGLKAVHEGGIGILAGEHGEKTWAHYRLDDVEQVRLFLEELYTLLAEKE
ncbi:trehalose-phosphatase [Cesiribacter andamanensis]|uniref:Trehalose 6-phosphate phosphatase n=1 Tax=Cesiribacter andamanensis AMV16 TaxID=1279009 RepID=M7N0R9_9BACT|nr:trehalose-phosphatase [Cesiribacter andamanensis]EMR02258.1 Trehalose-phosphate phosphatase [Cesiribacter andamanensis AMV16]